MKTKTYEVIIAETMYHRVEVEIPADTTIENLKETLEEYADDPGMWEQFGSSSEIIEYKEQN